MSDMFENVTPAQRATYEALTVLLDAYRTRTKTVQYMPTAPYDAGVEVIHREGELLEKVSVGEDGALRLRGAAAGEEQQRTPLLDVIKRELKARGYEEVEPNPGGGGIWTHPDWGGASDKIIAAILDAFDEAR